MTEIEKNLKKMADEIPVPEKLSPDQIEKKLKTIGRNLTDMCEAYVWRQQR